MAVVVLAALIGYAVWRTAQEGIVRIQGDVANVVMLETVRDRTERPALQLRESVRAVEFVSDAAMAEVVVTRTLPTGKVDVQPETRFYKLTPTGWQRTAPIAAFWGPTATLDTRSLHFVFGSKDRAAAEQLAPSAEALYTVLRRVTGQDLAEDGLLTVEIVPDQVMRNGLHEAGRVRLTSPLLYRTASPSRQEILGRLLRHSLAEQMLDAALQGTAPKVQWLRMVEAFGSWMRFSDAVQPMPAGGLAALQRLQSSTDDRVPLASLLAGVMDHGPKPPPMSEGYSPGALFQQDQRWAAAEQLIDFIAATYGIDVLPKLLQGFGQHDDWETLAPAVLGVSAAELEAAWHASSPSP